jgi:predicted CXXCH cytochrome family protein
MWRKLSLAMVALVLILQTSVWPEDLGIATLQLDSPTLGITPEAHREQPCGTCHRLAAESGTAGSQGIDNSDQCLVCHGAFGTKSSQLSSLFHRLPERACTGCHSFHRTDRLSAGGREFSVNPDEIARYVCETCHRESDPLENLSLGHARAAEFYHSDTWGVQGGTPTSTCLQCHSRDHMMNETGDDRQEVITISLAASHPVEIPVEFSSNRSMKIPIDPRISLYDGTIQCQSCHNLTSGAAFSLAKFESPYDLCLGCHDHNDQATPSPALAKR